MSEYQQLLKTVAYATPTQTLAKAIDCIAYLQAHANKHLLVDKDYLDLIKKGCKDLLKQRMLDAKLHTFAHKLTTHVPKTFELIDKHVQTQVNLAKEHVTHTTHVLPTMIASKAYGIVLLWGNYEFLMPGILEAHATKKLKRVLLIDSPHAKQTAHALAKQKIPVTYYNAHMIREAIKDCDRILCTGFAMDYHHKIYAYMGAELLAQTADALQKDTYIVMDSWSYFPLFSMAIETHKHEAAGAVENPPKGITNKALAYEKIAHKHIRGIICQEGIFTCDVFVKKFSI